MSKLVVDGASLQCSHGTTPAALTVLPTGPATGDERPMATVMDHLPIVNIAPFGMCNSPANPQVAAATAAAQGVLTPQPCVPVTSAPWSPGSPVVTLNDVKALTADSKCLCAWSGTLEVTAPGTALIDDG
jgi:hypothetical protein